MKRKIIFILGCSALLSFNIFLMNWASAQDSENLESDSFFNDDSQAQAPLIYDDNGQLVNQPSTASIKETLENAENVDGLPSEMFEEEETQSLSTTPNTSPSDYGQE